MVILFGLFIVVLSCWLTWVVAPSADWVSAQHWGPGSAENLVLLEATVTQSLTLGFRKKVFAASVDTAMACHLAVRQKDPVWREMVKVSKRASNSHGGASPSGTDGSSDTGGLGVLGVRGDQELSVTLVVLG